MGHAEHKKVLILEVPCRVICLSLPACRLYAYEGVGMLLGQEDLAADEQHAYVAALLQPLIQQVGATRLFLPKVQRKWILSRLLTTVTSAMGI